MTDITVTEMRKDLFRIIDEMIERGEPIRIRRGKVSVELTPRVLEKSVADMTPAERFERWLAKGVREEAVDWRFDHTDKSHWEWNPDEKFKDLLEP